MKKSYHLSAIVAMLMVMFQPAHAQVYSSGDIHLTVDSSMVHDSSYCQSTCNLTYNFVINSSFLGDSVQVIDSFWGTLAATYHNTTGANPWTFTVPAWTSTQSDLGIPITGGERYFNGPTHKIIRGTDTIYSVHNDRIFYINNPCAFSQVGGLIYLDINENCTYDAGDLYIDPGFSVFYTALENLSGPVPVIGDFSAGWSPGNYQVNVQQSWMTDFTIRLDSTFNFIFPSSSCAAGTYTFTSLPGLNADFPLQGTGAVDLSCWSGTPPFARPLIPFYLRPVVSNLGIEMVSGQLVLVKDHRVDYDAALSPLPADIVSGDTLIWNYSNLTCLVSGAYWNNLVANIHLTPNATVGIGDTLCFHTYTGVPSTEINPLNNDHVICIPVVNSYDPNIKEVLPKGTGPEGLISASTPELDYTIHFQNTGTAAAINIVVIDTLDSDVDPASLRVLSNSHRMTPRWLAPNVVAFRFDNIWLADSFSNEPMSHGYVHFSVKPHSGLTPGTQIKNRGYIYFDNNSAVITNTALNTIGSTTSVLSGTAVKELKVYPNPAMDELFVEGVEGTINICNVTGQNVLTIQGCGKNAIDISRLTPGVYIVKTSGSVVTRFVKQ